MWDLQKPRDKPKLAREIAQRSRRRRMMVMLVCILIGRHEKSAFCGRSCTCVHRCTPCAVAMRGLRVEGRESRVDRKTATASKRRGLADLGRREKGPDLLHVLSEDLPGVALGLRRLLCFNR